MRILTPRFIFAIGVCFLLVAASGCVTFGGSSSSTARSALVGEQPCRAGLIVVEEQADAPVRISNLKTDCRNPNVPGAGFQVEPNVARPIRRYEVRILHSYDGVYDGYSSDSAGTTGADGGPVFSKDSSSSSYMSWGLKRGWFKDPEPKFTFTVWSVTFTDGSTWNRASPVAENGL